MLISSSQISTGEQAHAAVGILTYIPVGSVNVTAKYVVDVSNVLNNNTVTVTALNGILNNLTIDNVLHNTLRDAEIIKNNEVVVRAIVNA